MQVHILFLNNSNFLFSDNIVKVYLKHQANGRRTWTWIFCYFNLGSNANALRVCAFSGANIMFFFMLSSRSSSAISAPFSDLSLIHTSGIIHCTPFLSSKMVTLAGNLFMQFLQCNLEENKFIWDN